MDQRRNLSPFHLGRSPSPVSRSGIMVYNLSAFISYYDFFLLVGILYLPIFCYIYIILFI